LLEEFDFAFHGNFDWKAVDIWSIGMILSTIIRGSKPLFPAVFSDNIESAITEHILQNLHIQECRPDRETLSKMLSPQFPIQKKWSSQDGFVSISTLLRTQPSLPGKKRDIILNANVESNGLEDLVANMLHFNPTSRKSCQQLLKHRFFSNYKPLAGQFIESSQEWIAKVYPFSDKSLFEYVNKCGGSEVIV